MLVLTAIIKKISAFLYDCFWFCVDNWRVVLPILCVLVLAVCLFRYCSPQPKPIDEKKIQEAIVAIEQKNDAKLKEILVSIDVEEKQIDGNVAYGQKELVNAAAEARKKYSDMNTQELANELEKRK